MSAWAYLGILVIITAACGGIFKAGGAYTEAQYAKRDAAAIKAAYEARDEALRKVTEMEAKSRKDVEAAETKARKDSDENKLKVDRAVADAGEHELRNVAAICAASNRSAATKAGTAARKAAEAEGAKLRRAYAEPFIRLAGEADEVVIERNEAVDIAKKDREICGASSDR